MQYFKPEDPFFAGDCMPFYHNGVFHLFYLLDENHHQGKGGLGGHQWAHASTSNLRDWTHHPLAIPCTQDWEGSICTGSLFFHNDTYYAYYATRMLNRTQHLSLAKSQDCVAFEKTHPNPFASPGKGYDPYHYRDPFVFLDEKTTGFTMLVTACLEDPPLEERGGCLVRLSSKDLHNWQVGDPFLIPGYDSAPECADYFFWNGWYYLVFSHQLVAHYRMSRQPDGPWLYPPIDVFEGEMARVMKTAPYGEGRRIGAAFIGTREGNQDNGQAQWAGHVVFREIIQNENGNLGVKFPPEMIPQSGQPLELQFANLTSLASGTPQQIALAPSETIEVAALSTIPINARITMRVKPDLTGVRFGLRLRGSGQFRDGYDLVFLPVERRVQLNRETIAEVDRLGSEFMLDIIQKDDLIDVCIDNRRCLIDRCPELKGEILFFYSQCGAVIFDEIKVRPLTS